MRLKKIVSAVVMLSVAAVMADESPDVAAKVKDLKRHLKIGSVTKSDFREDKLKFERVKVVTQQKDDDPFLGTLRFTVQFGNKTEMYWGQVQMEQKSHPSEYTGTDEWTFEFPHGEMKNPNIAAYAVEYGWVEGGVFTPVVQKFYKIKESADEITANNADADKKLDIKVTAKQEKNQS